MNDFRAHILMPEGTLFDGQVTGVRVPGTMGSFEIKVHHANIISTLEVGEVVLRIENEEPHHLAISGGFVEMVENELSLMAEAAEKIEKIDIDRAKASKNRAQERLDEAEENEEIDAKRARKSLARAENRLALAVKTSAAAAS